MTLNKKVYDALKWIAQYLLPAIGTLYFGIGRIWGFPFSSEITGTIMAIDSFLGILLGISSYSYEGDGVLHISKSADKDNYLIEVNCPLETLANNQTFMLRVHEETPKG